MLLSVNVHFHLAKQCNCNSLKCKNEDYIHKEMVTTKQTTCYPSLYIQAKLHRTLRQNKDKIILSNNILEQKKVLLQSLRVVLSLPEYILSGGGGRCKFSSPKLREAQDRL